MMLNVLLSIFIWFKLSLNKFLMCKKIFLLTIPNRTYKLMASRPGVEHTPRTHSIPRGIRRGSSKILKYKLKTRLLALLRRKRRRRNTRRLTTPMILLQVKNRLLILTTYLPLMLKLKTVLSPKKMIRRRMILLKCEKKKHPINARSILEKTSSQEVMGRKEKHWYRNPCPFQVSLSNI